LRGQNAVFATAIHHHPSCLKLLLLAKADLDVQLPDGQTALCVTGAKHRLDCLQLLIGAEV
jgi:hypothetical protein